MLFGDTSGLSATNYKESSGWEFIPAGCSLGIPVLQLGQTPHMPGKFPVRAPDSEELLSSGNPLSDLSVIGVVDLQPQGTPGPSQPRRHQNLQSPSQNPLARVAAPPVPVDITSPSLGIRSLTLTGLLSQPSIQTPEWDNYDSSSSFQLYQNFWQSKNPSETDPRFLDIGALGQIQALKKVDKMGDESKEMRGSLQHHRNSELENRQNEIKVSY